MTDVAAPSTSSPLAALDKLGVLIAAIASSGAIASFAAFRANRIVLGEGRSILDSLPAYEAIFLSFVIVATILVALFRTPAALRLFASLVALTALLIFIGRAGTYLTPPGDSLARVSPATGFWLMLFGFALLAADALTRLKLKPLARIGILLVV